MADNAENEEKIVTFMEVTGITSRERAKQILETTNYDSELALTTFFEDQDDDLIVNEAVSEPTPQQEEARPQFVEQEKIKKKSKKSNFATLRSLESSSDEEADDKGQAFYAGGSEHGSGQQIINPHKKNPIREMVHNIFHSAQSGNMEQFDPAEGSSSGRGGGRSFVGTGYRLGETESDTVEVKQPTRPGINRSNSESDVVTVKIWRQGFSIDDGDLRPFDDPKNKEFFQCIMRNQIPPELQRRGTETCRLNVEDHMNEEFVKPVPKFRAFAGSGHTLGSPTPNTAQETTPISSATPAAAPQTSSETGSPAENEARAASQLNVDPTQPTTMIQIRLADGLRLSAQFNVSHTVNDIRSFVTTARPQYASQNFMLLTTFPNKELADGSETIEKAGLKNAAILQRLK